MDRARSGMTMLYEGWVGFRVIASGRVESRARLTQPDPDPIFFFKKKKNKPNS